MSQISRTDDFKWGLLYFLKYLLAYIQGKNVKDGYILFLYHLLKEQKN